MEGKLLRKSKDFTFSGQYNSESLGISKVRRLPESGGGDNHKYEINFEGEDYSNINVSIIYRE